jgi:hypothetical protein
MVTLINTQNLSEKVLFVTFRSIIPVLVVEGIVKCRRVGIRSSCVLAPLWCVSVCIERPVETGIRRTTAWLEFKFSENMGETIIPCIRVLQWMEAQDGILPLRERDWDGRESASRSSATPPRRLGVQPGTCLGDVAGTGTGFCERLHGAA